jgi:hypothetical protein
MSTGSIFVAVDYRPSVPGVKPDLSPASRIQKSRVRDIPFWVAFLNVAVPLFAVLANHLAARGDDCVCRYPSLRF